MHRTIPTLMLLLLSAFAFSQSNKEGVYFVQSVFGMDKKALVSQFIKLEGTVHEAFCSAYEEYEVKWKELKKDRVSLLNLC